MVRLHRDPEHFQRVTGSTGMAPEGAVLLLSLLQSWRLPREGAGHRETPQRVPSTSSQRGCKGQRRRRTPLRKIRALIAGRSQSGGSQVRARHPEHSSASCGVFLPSPISSGPAGGVPAAPLALVAQILGQVVEEEAQLALQQPLVGEEDDGRVPLLGAWGAARLPRLFLGGLEGDRRVTNSTVLSPLLPPQCRGGELSPPRSSAA